MSTSPSRRLSWKHFPLAVMLVHAAESFQAGFGPSVTSTRGPASKCGPLARKTNLASSFSSSFAAPRRRHSNDDDGKRRASNAPPQIVEFVEPTTNVKVILVGTMHYNPTSIRTVDETIDRLGSDGSLGSVVVESCDVRWNATSELLSTRRGRLLKPVITSEMKVATDRASEYGVPVVLGDQRVNVTGSNMGEAFRRTIFDLATPIGGGWKRLYDDVRESADAALPSGPGYLTFDSLFDPRLVIAAPVSFLKYPLSFLARNPVSTMMAFASLFALNSLDGGGGALPPDASLEEQLGSVLASLMVFGLEMAFFSRVFLQVLLAERNEILAQNILDQCKLYSNSKCKRSSNIGFGLPLLDLFSWFPTKTGRPNRGTDASVESTGDIVYVPGTQTRSSGWNGSVGDGPEKVVVAILGMAHCNGIQKLLKEQRV